MDILNEYKENIKKLKEIQTNISKLTGQKEQLMERLKDEFDVSTLEEAKNLLVKLGEDFDETEKNLAECKEEMDKIISEAPAKSN